MTTYQTPAEPGKLQPYAPLDPQALYGLAQHALDVLMSAAIGPERETLAEAGAQLAIALSEFARLVEADADDQLAQGEGGIERLCRASLHVHEHMDSVVPSRDLDARNVELIERGMEEGLPVVGSVTAELLLAGGQTATVRLTRETAHQEVELNDSRAARHPAAAHLIVRDGLHDLARLLAPLARETSTGGEQ